MGRIARAEGRPAIVPPFWAPDQPELRGHLAAAGLPEDGMEQLCVGGEKLGHRSTVGWVYWGRLGHTAQERLAVAVGPEGGQLMGALGYRTLLENKAFANMHDYLNTCSAEREDAATLARRVARGPVEPAGPPAPQFVRLTQFLRLAGIRAELEGGKVKFAFEDPDGIELARPLAHPWLSERELKTIGKLEDLPDCQELDELGDLYADLLAANARLKRMVASQAPEPLAQPALEQLQKRASIFLQALLQPDNLRFQNRVLFSGNAVLAPGPELRWDQVGLPAEMAWTLFGAQVERRLGGAGEVEKRSAKAAVVLDEIMADSWVVLYSNREVLADASLDPLYHLPPVSLLAFRPVRHPDPVLRLHPRVCGLMEVYFDGGVQLSVLLPLIGTGQEEAGARLSLVGQVQRDPDVFRWIADSYHGMLWGLARLNLTEEGRREIAAIAGMEIETGLFHKEYLSEILRQIFLDAGLEQALEVCDRLMHRGFEVCKSSGVSFNPFLGAGLEWPLAPEGEDPELWRLYSDEVIAALFAQADYEDDDLGPLVLLCRSGARGNQRQLSMYLGEHGVQKPMEGKTAVVRHGLCTGLTAAEMLSRASRALWGLAESNREWMQMRTDKSTWVDGYHVIGRALRARQPGVVFARAAHRGEVARWNPPAPGSLWDCPPGRKRRDNGPIRMRPHH